MDRIVRRIYESRDASFKETEIKGSSLSIEEKERIATMTKGLIERDPDFRLVAITVDKTKVAEHIRRDSNKLYNYMIQVALLKQIPLIG